MIMMCMSVSLRLLPVGVWNSCHLAEFMFSLRHVVSVATLSLQSLLCICVRLRVCRSYVEHSRLGDESDSNCRWVFCARRHCQSYRRTRRYDADAVAWSQSKMSK